MKPASLALARARRRRQKTTGAAFVEALIVIGLIVVAMQCIWWMFQFTLFKHRAYVEANQKAWERALKGCADPEVDGPLKSLSKSAGNPSDVGGLRADSETAPSWFGIGSAGVSTVDLPLPQEVFGKSTVVAKAEFACNEKGGKKPLSLGGGGPSEDQAISDALQ